MTDPDRWVCSNCGGTSISAATIQPGIGGKHYLGLCHDCAPRRAILPEERDQSPKANKTRHNILLAGPLRTKLSPLVRAADYRPRIETPVATSLTLFDEKP